jgi:hypothetical protein
MPALFVHRRKIATSLTPARSAIARVLAPPLGPLLWPSRSNAMIGKGIRATCARPDGHP